jgi:hypothetical protein
VSFNPRANERKPPVAYCPTCSARCEETVKIVPANRVSQRASSPTFAQRSAGPGSAVRRPMSVATLFALSLAPFEKATSSAARIRR